MWIRPCLLWKKCTFFTIKSIYPTSIACLQKRLTKNLKVASESQIFRIFSLREIRSLFFTIRQKTSNYEHQHHLNAMNGWLASFILRNMLKLKMESVALHLPWQHLHQPLRQVVPSINETHYYSMETVKNDKALHQKEDIRLLTPTWWARFVLKKKVPILNQLQISFQ